MESGTEIVLETPLPYMKVLLVPHQGRAHAYRRVIAANYGDMRPAVGAWVKHGISEISKLRSIY